MSQLRIHPDLLGCVLWARSFHSLAQSGPHRARLAAALGSLDQALLCITTVDQGVRLVELVAAAIVRSVPHEHE